MGCWNGTCGVSQLPITGGTKVKAFLLLQSKYTKEVKGSGSCYSSEYFRPWFFPVTAEYNDYGSIENIQEDWNTKYMLETFQKWLAAGEVKILGDEKAEINSPGIRKFKILENVFDCVERGALQIKDCGETFNVKKQMWVPANGYLKIGLFIVLENVYNDMVDASKRFINLKENSYYRKSNKESRQLAMEAINKARTIKPPNVLCSLDERAVNRVLGDSLEDGACFKHYKTIVYSSNITASEFFAKLDPVMAFGTAMVYLRKLWIPQTGQGSQNEELAFNKALIASMLLHIYNREKPHNAK